MARDEIIHNRLTVSNKTRAELNGVLSVESFDSSYLSLETSEGQVNIEGESLKIESLIREGGEITVSGKITAVYYTTRKKKTSLLSRIFG